MQRSSLKKAALPFLLAFFQVLSSFASEEEATNLLARDFLPIVRTTTRPFYVYHWLTSKKLSPYGTSSEKKVFDRLRKISKDFYSADNDAYGLVGKGIYAARDPQSSSRYGEYKDDWILVSIEIPVATKFLDIRFSFNKSRPLKDPIHTYNGNRFTVHPETRKALYQIGCSIGTEIQLRDFLKNSKCSGIYKNVIRRLKVSGTIHQWYGGAVRGCRDSVSTFTLFNEELITDDHVWIYTKNSINGLDTEGNRPYVELMAFIYSVWSENVKTDYPEGTSSPYVQDWSSADIALRKRLDSSSSSFLDIKNSHIYDCSGKFDEEEIGSVQDPTTFKIIASLDDKEQIPASLFTSQGYDAPLLEEVLPKKDPVNDYLIEVLSASYGGFDVTSKAASFVNNKKNLDYKISKKFLGDPSPGKAKDFKIKWNCVDRSRASTLGPFEHSEAGAIAEGSVFKMRCP